MSCAVRAPRLVSPLRGQQRHDIARVVVGLVLPGWLLIMGGCALQRHEPATASPARAQVQVLERSPTDPALRPLLERQGIDTRRWPLPSWDAASLRALALAWHPQVRAAQAELLQAQAARTAGRAAARPGALQALELNLERHSDGGAAPSPWTVGVALDFGLSEAALGVSRRASREAAADALADEAATQGLLAVWQVQRSVRDAHLAWLLAQHRADVALALERARTDEAAAWQTRLSLGAADAVEAGRARQRQAQAVHEARQAEAARLTSRQALAAAVGLTMVQLDVMVLAREEWLAPAALAASVPPSAPERAAGQAAQTAQAAHARRAAVSTGSSQASPASSGTLLATSLQQAALLDRLDVRAGVARYAAADAALRLELARQLPELVLKPGWAWDQGDRRWSLGVGITLPPAGGNRAAINEASARRDAEAARFETVQLQALGELAAAQAGQVAARAELDRSRALADAASRLAARAQARLAAGSADRLEVLEARVAVLEAQRRVLDARAVGGRAWAALEDAVQRPLDTLDTLSRPRGDWLAGSTP